MRSYLKTRKGRIEDAEVDVWTGTIVGRPSMVSYLG